MARPPLPVGTYGIIRTEQLGPHRHCARARFRDYDGTTRDVEATGPTGPAATRALKEKLRDRVAPNDDEIARETYVHTLADLWLQEIIAEERVTPQTISRYEISIRVSIKPGLGNLRIREAGPAASTSSCARSPRTGRQQPRARRSSSVRCSPWRYAVAH